MKRVLVSGGSRGIGAEIVREFAASGDKVAFLYHQAEKAAQNLERETGAAAVCADVGDPDAVRRAVREATEKLGGAPEIVVASAGVSSVMLSRDTSDAEWRRVTDTDLSGVFYLARECQGEMIRAGWGRMIFIGSMWGKVGASMEAAYSAAKAGVRGLTMALAKELGPSGITVNCVEPGVIDTEMNAFLGEAERAALVEATPLCRIGTVFDVAAAVRFFADEKAGFITGQMLGVDGGFAV